jgi:hypothetical protein
MPRYPRFDPTKIHALADGTRSSSEIAALTGFSAKYVQSVLLRDNLPRLKPGPPSGKKNPDWNGGLAIELDGYLLVRLPQHPRARKSGQFLAHRYLMEIVLGRLLTPVEVVDHWNGCTLDTREVNLRLFASNADHIAATLTGKVPKWSPEGFANIQGCTGLPVSVQRIHTYQKIKASGVVRERQIRRLHELHGTTARALLQTELRRLEAQGRQHPVSKLEYLLED